MFTDTSKSNHIFQNLHKLSFNKLYQIKKKHSKNKQITPKDTDSNKYSLKKNKNPSGEFRNHMKSPKISGKILYTVHGYWQNLCSSYFRLTVWFLSILWLLVSMGPPGLGATNL